MRRSPRTSVSDTGSSGSAMSTVRSWYSKIRANSASELATWTPTSSSPESGRKIPACSEVKATRVPIESAPTVQGRPAPT